MHFASTDKSNARIEGNVCWLRRFGFWERDR